MLRRLKRKQLKTTEYLHLRISVSILSRVEVLVSSVQRALLVPANSKRAKHSARTLLTHWGIYQHHVTDKESLNPDRSARGVDFLDGLTPRVPIFNHLGVTHAEQCFMMTYHNQCYEP